MKMKQFFALGAMVLMLGIFLAGCGQSNLPANDSSPSENTTEQESGTEEQEVTANEQTLSGVINRMGDFLVLLTDEGEYQIMNLAEGISLDDFEEGDSVTVTYTGELGDEETPPVISAIELAE